MYRYYLALSFGGDTGTIEEEIYNLLGISDGSGAGFGKRDLSYYFNNKNSLRAAVRKVRRLRRKIKCEAWENNINVSPDEDEYYDQKPVSLKGIK